MQAVDKYLFITFFAYLALLIIIGTVAWHRTRSLSDYVLGGRKLGEWTTALSAGASDMSGWLLLGLPGYAYLAGFEAVWIAIGLFFGSWVNWLLIAPRLRSYSEYRDNALTLPEFLEKHFKDSSHLLRIVSALLIMLFFIMYTSSGLVAGGKLFESVFDLPYLWAVVTGTIAILIYTTIGGFLAVSWTDLFQGLLMALALIVVGKISYDVAGGWNIMVNTLEVVDPSMVRIINISETPALSLIALLSLLGWGLGYFGQPHILARFMAIKSVAHIPKARRIAITWTGFNLTAALVIGFAGVAVLDTPLSGPDSEKVFIELVTMLFHPATAGICLAAILAAIMSTADSQLLVASSVFTEDLYQLVLKKPASQSHLILVNRLSVIVVSIIAFILALSREQTVLDLVAYAWAGFGATLGPVLILTLYWNRLTKNGALAGMLAGGITVIVWHHLEGGWFELYEIIPAFIFSMTVSILVSLYLNKN